MKNNLIVAVLLVVATAACNGGPLAPDPHDPVEDSVVVVNETIQSSDGSLIVQLEKMTPGRGVTAKVGDDALFWMTFRNSSSDMYLRLRGGVIENPAEEGVGRSTPIIQGWKSIPPGGQHVGMLGWRATIPEEVPWLRFAGCYTVEKFGTCRTITVSFDIETRWRFIN